MGEEKEYITLDLCQRFHNELKENLENTIKEKEKRIEWAEKRIDLVEGKWDTATRYLIVQLILMVGFFCVKLLFK